MVETKLTIDLIAMIAASALGLLGLGFGLYQYYVAQKWKRSEFAAAQLEKLTSDPVLAMTCKLLDWQGRTLPVPEAYLALATPDTTFAHSYELFAASLMASRRQGGYSWVHAMYRDHLDRFCEYLQSLNHYVSIDLVELRDVATVKYWLRELALPRYANEGDKLMFIRFIEFFQYDGVVQLMKRFGVDTRIEEATPSRRGPLQNR